MRAVLKNKVLVAIIAILLLTNIVMLVFLLGKKSDKPHDRRTNTASTPYLQKELGFTEQQMAQFNSLKEEHREKINSLFDEARKTKDSFFLLLKDSTVSDSALVSASALIGDKQQALDMQVFESLREIRKLCTSQQQQKFDSLLPKIVYKMAGQIRRKPKEDSLKRKD